MRTKLRLLSSLSLALSSAAELPSWLVPYPGAEAVLTRPSQKLVESSYTTSASSGQLIAHYRILFDAAHLRFHPNGGGMGTTSVRAGLPECDLLITIREQAATTAVRASCTARSVEAPAPVPPVVVAPPAKRDRGVMEKYDEPFYPKPRTPAPPLVWPRWLVLTDGSSPNVERGVDAVGLHFLRTVFVTSGDRNTILAFYASLLNANGYPVESQSGPQAPVGWKAWIRGANLHIGDSGRRNVIRVEARPVSEGLEVDIRLTAGP
jgi:hypothetical protein